MRMIVAVGVLLIAAGARAESFSFVALGDTAYNGERDYAVYRELIASINAVKPAFTIHVGDIWGAGSCSDSHLKSVASYFALYQQPLIYTPGDNEWTDCGSRNLGGFDPSERLQALRALFFRDGFSLGQTRLPLVRQGTVSPQHKAYAENVRWERAGVLFVTVNIPGSNNGFDYENAARLSDAHARTRAVIAWIRDSFRIAREQGLKAVVLAYHAEMFASPDARDSGFAPLVREIQLAADRFARPVLLVHGDAHTFKIDRPLMRMQGESVESLHANVTRLQVFGAPEIKAVRVDVDPSSAAVFGFTPLY